jgi:hypothetical protein
MKTTNWIYSDTPAARRAEAVETLIKAKNLANRKRLEALITETLGWCSKELVKNVHALMSEDIFGETTLTEKIHEAKEKTI